MQVKNNPAGRLFDILNLARQQGPRESARKVWATVFDVSPDDTGSILKMLADLIDLAHETKAAIRKLDDIDHKLHLRPFKNIEKLLSHLNMESAWEPLKNQIDDS